MSENFNFEAEAADLLRRAIRDFAEWAGENWTIAESEARTLTDPTDAPAAYARGWNDGLRTICDAADLWMEE